jgi:hypothetical protein
MNDTTREELSPYGCVTTHSTTGQQFFYRHPALPYLDNAKECVWVYAAPQPQASTQEPVAKIVYDGDSLPMLAIGKQLFRLQLLDGGQWFTCTAEASYAPFAAPQPQAPSATSDDVRAALADARDKALEEAAKVCDGINHQYTSSGGHAAERCAAAIRALRTTSEK